jgi:hypothetical protein
MTRFTLGGKCGRPGRPPLSAFALAGVAGGGRDDAQPGERGGAEAGHGTADQAAAAELARAGQRLGAVHGAHSLVIASSRLRMVLATVA